MTVYRKRLKGVLAKATWNSQLSIGNSLNRKPSWMYAQLAKSWVHFYQNLIPFQVYLALKHVPGIPLSGFCIFLPQRRFLARLLSCSTIIICWSDMMFLWPTSNWFIYKWKFLLHLISIIKYDIRETCCY